MDRLLASLGLAGGGLTMLADVVPAADAGTLEFVLKTFGAPGVIVVALWLILDKRDKSNTALQGDLKESGAKLLEMTTRAVTAQERGNAELAGLRSEMNTQTGVIRVQTESLNRLTDRCPGTAPSEVSRR